MWARRLWGKPEGEGLCPGQTLSVGSWTKGMGGERGGRQNQSGCGLEITGDKGSHTGLVSYELV